MTDADADAGRERRSAPRISAELEVTFETLDDFVTAYTLNVSRSGLFVPTTKFLPIGAVVALNVQLPTTGKTVHAIVRVAYLLDAQRATEIGGTAGMGMEFLDVGGKPFADQITEHLTTGAAPPETTQRPSRRPMSVLVVDDELFYRQRTSSAMRDAGYEVTMAKDGLDALGKALREPPNVILTDVTMPGLDGWQLLRIVRARPALAHIPVIFLTTLTSDQERLKGYRLGVDDYLGKPFADEELVARVTRVIDRSRSTGPAATKALRGDLSQVALPTLLSLVEMERRTGSLVLVRDDEIITLHIREGLVLRIDLPKAQDELSGIARFFYALDWTTGNFELSSVDVTFEDGLNLPTSFVLLEYARCRDET